MLAAAQVSCIKYHPHPLDPPASEEQFRARTFADPGLRAFLNRNEWPPSKLGLNELDAVALYFNADLDVARTQLRTAQAAIVAAKGKQNPSLSTGAGYETDSESNLLFNFFPSLTVVTAGKRAWRTLEAEKLADAARVAVEETAWKIQSRVRAAWLDYLVTLRSLDILQQERSLRAETVQMLDHRVMAGEASRPEADIARAALLSVDLTAKAEETHVAEVFATLAATVGLPALPAIDMRELPSVPESLPLADVQKAGLLHRADIRRSL